MAPDMENLRQEVEASISGLTGEQLSWHPPGKWSAAEVLEHLFLTYTGTIKGFDRFETSQQPRTAATWRQRRSKLAVVALGYMPPGREAPTFARPRGLPVEKVLSEIGPKIAEMDEVIRRSERKYGTRAKLLEHVFLGPLTGPEWRKFHLVHGRHHLKQVRELRERAKRADCSSV